MLEDTGEVRLTRLEEVEAHTPPQLPPALQAMQAPRQHGQEHAGEMRYTVTFDSPDEELVPSLYGISILVRLQEKPPPDALGLERRIINDESEALKVLHSFGYYAGSVKSDCDYDATPAAVKFVLAPGPRYHLETLDIRYASSVAQWKNAPKSLEDIGLTVGQDARASAVLDAVGTIDKALQDHGFPFAKLGSERYTVDHASQTLHGELVFEPGAYVTMGKVRAEGSESVRGGYFERLRTWDVDEPWKATQIARYQDHLASQGLFRAVHSAPSEAAVQGSRHDVVVAVADAPQRTILAGIHYDTDRGPGTRLTWEHRNVAGEGERFRLEGEWWKDTQVLRSSFRIPVFPRRDMDFIAEAGFRNEFTDAFDQTAMRAAAGFDRRFWEYWKASIRLTAEGGTLASRRNPRSEYVMGGVPVAIRRDSTNDALDPTRGSRASFSVAPYMGTLQREFTAAVTRFDGSAYYDVMNDGRLVLAASVGAGSITKDGGPVPASLLFYSGGGGSVRGYAYQSLGPLDADNDPLGGMSLLETKFEMRVKITDTIGIVPFIDGGNVYDSSNPFASPDLRWAVGLGARYYTSIGPMRFDVGVPLNKREDDAPWQVYISIGQSF